MLMRRNVAAGIGEYCRAALQRSDRKELRYKWSTLLYFTLLCICIQLFIIYLQVWLINSVQFSSAGAGDSICMTRANS